MNRRLTSVAAGRPGNYKLALLGVGGVGKSCITLKYIKGAFTDVYDPSIEVRCLFFFPDAASFMP